MPLRSTAGTSAVPQDAHFRNKKNQLIADKIMNRGAVDHAPVYPREFMRRWTPAGSLRIAVHDHLIVGSDGMASLKALGLF